MTMLAIALFIGYLSGSVPYGLLFTRLAGLGDIRALGSGNIGTTNVLRTGRKSLALLTLLADSAKSALPVFVFTYYISPTAGMLAGFAAFIGHIAPIWLRFRGGKGIAVYIGALLGLSPYGALCFCLLWIGSAFVFRMSSLSALIACVLTPIYLFFFETKELAYFTIVLSFIVVFTHRENIGRLIRGEEPRIGQK